MKRAFFTLLASSIYTVWMCHDIVPEIGFKGCALVFLMAIGFCWLVVTLADCLLELFVALCGMPPKSSCWLTEPDEDAVFSDGEQLVNVNTGKEIVPPEEVYVHEYLWDAAQSRPVLNRTIPLSEWQWAEMPEGADHVVSRAAKDSEFDEIERRLSAPEFNRQ